MRFFRTRLHAYVVLVLLASLLVAGIVLLLLPRERVTRANFDKIEIGMSVADVERLLGPPDFEYPPNPYFDSQGRKQRYQDCAGHGWSSPEITILLISNGDSRIVRRDRADGQTRATVFQIVLTWIMRHF